MENISPVISRIKELMGGLSQREFAKKIGASPASVNMWLTGKRFPKTDAIVRICEATGTRKDWLLSGEGEQKVSKDSEFITRQEFEEFSKMYLITNPPDKDDEDFLKEVVPKLKLLAAKKGMTVYQYVSEILENDI